MVAEFSSSIFSGDMTKNVRLSKSKEWKIIQVGSAQKVVVIKMYVLNLHILMKIKNSFFQTSKNDMTIIFLQLMTNKQNELAYLTERKSLTFVSLQRIR